jgi:hypothetical protein
MIPDSSVRLCAGHAACHKRPRHDVRDDSRPPNELKIACMMPFCETEGRVINLECAHSFCITCLESQMRARPKKRPGQYRPNLKRSKIKKAHVHVRMACALCVRPFKMSLSQLTEQPEGGVISSEVPAQPCQPSATARSLVHGQYPDALQHSQRLSGAAVSWQKWDLCWAKVVC